MFSRHMNMQECANHHNYHQAAAFFESYYTPAAIITGVSVVAFLQVTRHHRVETVKSSWEKFLVRQCHISFLLTFLLSGITLLLSSMTSLAFLREGLQQGQNQTAYSAASFQSPYALLMDKFRVEFVAVRWLFIVSIISCIRGVMIHIVLNHHLARDMGHDKKKEDQFFMVITGTISLLGGLFSYTNSTFVKEDSWTNFFGMTCDLFKQMVWGGSFEGRPLRTLSLFAGCLSLAFLSKVMFFDETAPKMNVTKGNAPAEVADEPKIVVHQTHVTEPSKKATVAVGAQNQ